DLCGRLSHENEVTPQFLRRGPGKFSVRTREGSGGGSGSNRFLPSCKRNIRESREEQKWRLFFVRLCAVVFVMDSGFAHSSHSILSGNQSFRWSSLSNGH
ncbi:unnamed protein product, partial [Hapterophycus canaliculatus]